MRRIQTMVNDKQMLAIREYCNKHGVSLYTLMKEALFDFLKRHPNGPPETKEQEPAPLF